MKRILFITLIVLASLLAFLLTHDKAISLEEAYALAYRKATKWCSCAQLSFVTSVDEDNSSQINGQNGKRRYWNLIFSDPISCNKQLIITIHDHKIVEFYPFENKVDIAHIINMSKLNLSSELLAKRARLNYKLLPSDTWARGYHFILRARDGRILFTITGLNEKSTFTKLTFDGNTSEFLFEGG